ncbi:hypothetical protein [Maricaulis sp.]|uniref:M61 family metallopeptidase n=1 Tax=Maricaulis sp. TaxID=1486257 RepID=UPI00260B227F|nr:hypothetical protein [Maricaulis sp.]
MILTALAAALAAHTSPMAAPSDMALYTVDVTPRAGEMADVRIRLVFTGEEDGETAIIMPNEWGGEPELWNNVSGLTLLTEGELTDGESDSLKLIRHEPGARIALEWRIVPDRPGHPAAESHDYYRPVITEDYVHMIGHTVFAYPQNLNDYRYGLWQSDNAESWALITDLQHEGEPTAEEFLTSIIVAGDFRVTEADVAGAPLRVAMRGDIGFSDEEFFEGVEEVLRANQRYWGTQGEPFLVTALPLTNQPGHSSLGGTNLADSFAFFATSNGEAMTLLRILQHEHVHTWNPVRLGGFNDGVEAQIADYWFSEGFTDFLTQRAGVLGGVWDAATAIQNWNDSLLEDSFSPVRGSPNSGIVGGFWSSAQYQRLAYHRGMVFAGLLDHMIREHSEGAQDLDDVMFALRETVADGAPARRLATVTRDVTGLDISDLIERHIMQGEQIALPAGTFGACGVVEQFERPRFVYGMEGVRNEAGEFVLVAVDPDGPAGQAGFEPGMTFEGRIGGTYGDASVDSVFRVRLEDGTVTDMSYRPTDGTIERGQHIIPAEGDLQTNGCATLIAGRPLN